MVLGDRETPDVLVSPLSRNPEHRWRADPDPRLGPPGPGRPARTVTILSTASVRSSCPAMSPAKSDSAWYGVARLPYTRRFANNWARRRSGWNNSAIVTAAAIVSTGPPWCPTNVPIPSTMPAYTSVNAAESRA